MKELKTVESHSVAIKSAEKKTKQVKKLGLAPCYFLPTYIGDKTEKVDMLKLHNLPSEFKRKKRRIKGLVCLRGKDFLSPKRVLL